MKKFIYIMCLAIGVMACEKEIKLNAEEEESRIVINSIFNEEDTLWLQLSESRSLLDDSFGPAPALLGADAKLMNADGGVIGTFTVNPSPFNNYYYLETEGLTIGNTYKIEVSKSGLKTVTSSSILPGGIEIESVDSTTIGTKLNEIKFTVNFQDNGAEKNYYILSSLLTAYEVDEFGDTLIYYESSGIQTSELSVGNGQQDIDGTTWGENLIFNDDLFNGKPMSFTFKQSSDNFGIEGIELETRYDIELKNVSEDYYKYRRSYSKYLDTQGSPFAEPVQVYSNIENGFGIFAGYSSSSKRIYGN